MSFLSALHANLAAWKGDRSRLALRRRKRQLIAALLADGLSQAEIGRRLGLSKATVSYHARRLGLPAKDRCARRYDWAEVRRAYDAGLSVRECAQRFGFALCSWHEAVKRGSIEPRPRRMPITKLLVADRQRTNRSHLKQRLLAEGLKENRCERCDLTDWREKPLNMALHHVNGDGKDNRLFNLELLCPNCHAQTENFAGRNLGRSSGEPKTCSCDDIG